MTKNEKNEMKSVIKPLIKECLHEIMLEEGLIRMVKEHVIKENVQKKAILPETKPVIRELKKENVDAKKQYVESIKKNASMSGFDPFAGTQDLDSLEAKADEGVDITKFFGN